VSKNAVKWTINAFFSLITFAAVLAARQPQFEVATVKLSPPPSGDAIPINLGTAINGTVTLTNTTLSECLQYAYGIVTSDLISGPDWTKSREVRFDIVAKAASDIAVDQLRLMLQSLLADRLKLAVHTEKREMSFLALIVAKNGPKLAPAKVNNDRPPQVAGRIVHPQMPMSMLATLLSRFERQTVIDQTGLRGPFSVELHWIPDALRERALQGGLPPVVNGQPMDLNGPSLYTALQEQLGLRLESRKGPVDVLVIDHADKVPEEN
jgi:uncharacterized protein (TIGR03435 family)